MVIGRTGTIGGGSGAAIETNRRDTIKGGNVISNQGSRIEILSNPNEMEMDMEETAEMAANVSRQQKESVGMALDEGTEVGTKETEAGNNHRVNISVSHMGLADSLRPLTGIKTNVRTSAQGDGVGSKKIAGRILKEVTNKLEARPMIAKQARPTSKANAAQTLSGIRILKRPGEVWRNLDVIGPPMKSPFEGPNSTRRNHEDGSGLDRPPDPPDQLKSSQDCPNPQTQKSPLGDSSGEQTGTESQVSEGDVAKVVEDASGKEEEEVHATIF